MQIVDTRFGGREADGVFRFELTGGALALDFVNTLDEREGAPKELLTDYQRLLEWSEQAGALDARTCARLKKAAAGAPRKAKETLKRAHDLREIMFSILAGLTRGDLSARDLDPLNLWIGRAGARTRLSFVDGAIIRSYATDGADFAAMLWPVIDSASTLLADHQSRARIKLCEGDRCAWAFVDTSRQGNKRWCDMSVCGNRAKAKRHRRRKREAGD